MPVVYKAKGSSGYIFDGWGYIQGDDGILRAFGPVEWTAYSYTHPNLIVAEWSAADILNLARRCGLYEFTGTQAEGDPLGLTGRVIGRNAPVDGSGSKTGNDDRRFL